MHAKQISRRDFLRISAVAGSLLMGGRWVNDIINPKTVLVQDTRILMGTIINLSLITDDRSAGESAVQTTFQELERLVQIFDHRRSESPLTMLNQDGYLDNPPWELLHVIRQAVHFGELTGGAFDITIKPLVDLYTRSWGRELRLPDKGEIANSARLVDYRQLLVSDSKLEFNLRGMGITLDGIAKGFIVDTEVDLLKKLGYENVMVEAGGDLMAAGSSEDRTPWRIGLRSPRDAMNILLGKFDVQNQAVATSGDYMQPYSKDFTQHHIINPRTGFSSPGLASTTVIASSAMLGDCLATTLMVLDQHDGMKLVESLPGVEACLVTKGMQIMKTSGFPLMS